jgi:FKBP-type peptidyl-prolyl cis-trans isomerase
MGRNKKQKRGKGSAGLNRKESLDFFVKNRSKPGVIETGSGLQYLIIDEGAGESPALKHEIAVNQRIMLLDGTVIKDTYKTGELDRFPLREGIEGLREGISLMKLGARYKFFVPPDLGWGKRGAGDKIGPYATLIFDIRLESFEY